MAEIKNIVFDIGNVLVDWDWKSYIERRFPDNEVRDALTKIYWGYEFWREMDRGAISQETIHREILKIAGSYENEMEIAYQNAGECLSHLEYTGPWISELKEKGYKVYYLSNYSDYLIKKRPDVLEFTKEMDGGIFSCYVKLLKPDIAIYECLCKKYDLEPSECLFLDDKIINVVAAREYGMQALQFTGYDETYPKVRKLLQENPIR